MQIRLFDFQESCEKSVEEARSAHQMFASDGIGFAAGARGIVSNGRLIGPLDEEEIFTLDDFNLLESFSLSTYVNNIYTALTKHAEGSNGRHRVKFVNEVFTIRPSI